MTAALPPTADVYADAECLAAGVARELVAAVAAHRGPFRIALSGGSTPRRLFEILAQQHRGELDWGRLRLFWGDERCVPPDHADSNYRMARAALLDHVPIDPAHVWRMPGEQEPAAGAAAYAATLQAHFATEGLTPPCFDLALQGVGTDGHTASLFPGTPALGEQHRWVVPVHTTTAAPPWRLSLTLPVLAQARDVWFVASGAAKRPVVQAILQDPAAAAGTLVAARLHVRCAQPRWFVDRDARGP